MKRLLVGQRQENWRQRKGLPGTQNTVNKEKSGKLGHRARDCRSITIVGEGETGEDNWTSIAEQWEEQQPEPETGCTIQGLWLCSLSHMRTHP